MRVRNAEILGISLILAAASLLRWYRLAEWSLWNDESHTIVAALGTLFTREPMEYLYPVNFLITHAFLSWFGLSEWSARLFPALAGIAGVACIWGLTRSLFGGGVGLLAAGFVGLSPWHIYWSQNARHYALLFLLVTIAMLCFYQSIEQENGKAMGISLLSMIAAILTHPSAALFLPAFFLYVVFLQIGPFQRPRGLQWKHLAIFFVPFAVLSFFALPKVGALVRYLLTAKAPWNPPSNVFLSVVYYLGVPFLTVSILAAAYLVIQGDRRGLFLGLVISVPVILLVIAANFTIASGAYAFPTLAAHAILAAYASLELVRQAQGKQVFLAAGLGLALVLNMAGNTTLYFIRENGNRPMWKAAFQFVKQRMGREDIIAASSGSVGDFYLGQWGRVTWLDHLDVEKINREGRQTWLVVLDDIEGILPLKGSISQLLRSEAVHLAKFNVNTGPKRREIDVYLYNPLSKGTRDRHQAAALARSGG